jgi:hypothetical protein
VSSGTARPPSWQAMQRFSVMTWISQGRPVFAPVPAGPSGAGAPESGDESGFSPLAPPSATPPSASSVAEPSSPVHAITAATAMIALEPKYRA